MDYGYGYYGGHTGDPQLDMEYERQFSSQYSQHSVSTQLVARSAVTPSCSRYVSSSLCSVLSDSLVSVCPSLWLVCVEAWSVCVRVWSMCDRVSGWCVPEFGDFSSVTSTVRFFFIILLAQNSATMAWQ